MPNEFRVCISSSREAWGQTSASIWITYSISFADINIMPQYIVYISGKVLREIKVSSVLLQVLSAHIPIHCIYLGRGQRSHKAPPDYCVGKSVLHGKI